MNRSMIQWQCPFCEQNFFIQYEELNEHIKMLAMDQIVKQLTYHICKDHKDTQKERVNRWLD